MTKHVAVLLTSNDTSEFAQRFPNDGEKVRRLLVALRSEWTFRVWAVKDGEFPPGPGAADAFIITGSPASVHDPLDWITRLLQFIREVDAARTPLIGLCFGHQAIALALGGRVERNPRGWRMGIAETHFNRIPSWASPAHRTLGLYASHCEQVTKLPSQADAIGGDDFCPIASYTIGRHVFTTQYHPEFTPEFMQGLTAHLDAKLPPQVIARARQEIRLPAQGQVFAEWIARFVDEAGASGAASSLPSS